MKILTYTFSTFPYQEDLQKIFPNTTILKKLKQDLESFFQLINKEKPDLILGIALSQKKHSHLEPIAINKFNKNSNVIKSGAEKYKLYIPNETKFKINNKPTTTFCNYTMYQTAHFLKENQIKTPFTFIHIKKEDIPNLPLLFNN